MDAAPHRGAGQVHLLHPRGQARHPAEARRGRGLREVPGRALHRHQALRPRRRRGDDPGAGADHQARRRARRAGDRARHGASRAPQRARPGDGQAPPRHLQRVQGRLRLAAGGRGLGRRQVPPRRLVGPRVRRQQGPPVADRQPVAPRDRRSRGAGQGARQAGPAERPGRAREGHAAAAARRRRLRGPGRDRGMLRPVGPEGPQDRRLDPLHHQQPDRLHHLPALFALLALPVRRGEDDRGADLPRQRRRPRGRDLRRQGGGGVPAALPQARRHRHVLLPPLRPQRGRRAGLHPAADVQDHPRPPLDAGALRREARRRGHRHGRGGRGAEGRVPRRSSTPSSRPARPTSPTRPTGSTAAGRT